jgi:hypothetical protein
MGTTNSQVLWLIENREKIFRYFFIPQFIAAIPFLWFGCATGKVHTHLLFKSAATTGTVVAVVPVKFSSRSSSLDFSTAYEAVVSFMAGSDEFRFQEWKATPIAPSIGTRVPVIYDPADPEVAMVDRGSRNYIPWLPFAAIGAFLFLVALKGLLTLLFRK